MTTRTFVGTLAALLAAAGPVWTAEYVSDAVCRMCHYAIYQDWSASPHAQAFAILTPDEQKRGECQPCHATARGHKAVQCEACHGAGGDYFPLPVMKDKVRAEEAGLKPVTISTCHRCHIGRAPHELKRLDLSPENLLALSHRASPGATPTPTPAPTPTAEPTPTPEP